MKDIDFNVTNQKFKYRVHEIIIHNKKVLTLKKITNHFIIHLVSMLNYVKPVKMQY